MTSVTKTSDPGTSGPPETMTPENKRAVALLLVSAFVVILNETVMSVALPHLMSDLAITAATAQWVTTAFMLTMAVVIPVTGFVIQRVSTRATFLTAMGLFTSGTLVCFLAPGFEVLLAGRMIQAGGTAIMMPLLMTTVMTVTPSSSRGRTMGNISIVISVAPALGPTLSGLVLTFLDWRWLFGLVLPIAVGALALGAARLTNLTTPRYARVDVGSVVLAALAFGGIVYGLSQFGRAAVSGAAGAWTPLLVGLVALAVFVWRQLHLQRSDRALLDLRPFTSPTFSVALGVMVISMMALFGTLILLPLYAQNVLGIEALEIGLLLLPGGLLMGLLAPLVGRAYDRVGPRVLLVPGSIVVSAASWAFALLLGGGTSAWVLMAVHALLGVGLSLMFTPLFTSALGSLPAQLYSHGSAGLGTLQQVAGAAGTALFVTVLTARSIVLADGGANEVEAMAGGAHTAFLVGACISLLAIPAALALRVPEQAAGSGSDAEPEPALETAAV